MFTCEGLLELHERAWRSLFRMLDHVATLPADARAGPLPDFGDQAPVDALVHVGSCEDWWIATARGEPAAEWESEPLRDVEALREVLLGVERRTRDYLEGLGDGALAEPVEMRYPGGSFATAPAWIVLHMVTHAFHHKGQVASMCRHLGHPAPDTDLDVRP